MEPFESTPEMIDSDTFVIRVWLEEIDRERGVARWRGQVVHARTGERRYLSSLNDIVDFVTSTIRRHSVDIEFH